MIEHEHPLELIDLWSIQLQSEEEYEEDEEDNEDLVPKLDFRRPCFRCDEEINWFSRYFYLSWQSAYHNFHKYCAELPERVEDVCEVGHTLYYFQNKSSWDCDICHTVRQAYNLCYTCSVCNRLVDAKCVTQRLHKNIIHHPSHKHPLVSMPKQILSECSACGKEHKGIFIRCTVCTIPFIHHHCAFLPKKLQIQHSTDNFFFHIHPLALAYSFPEKDQASKSYPRCRVCRKRFYNEKLWIYKCEKCRYYTHLDCATSRNEPFMSILASPGSRKLFKNYKDAEHPDLLHLPFLGPSYSILKHLFSKNDGSSTYKVLKTDSSHQHPVILEDARCTDMTSPTSSNIKSISYHDPMKRIELLCNGCVRPITSTPIYVCADEDEHCNFVLHEWCSRLPSKLKDHLNHPKHDLILHSKAPRQFFGVFDCEICELPCNGFVYCCEICRYYIDVHCAFLPKEITHTSHPNHILSRVYVTLSKAEVFDGCKMCPHIIRLHRFCFGCLICDVYLHPACALFIPETTTHMCDKHPLKLSYLPIENHKSEYFCEICEEELNPEYPFYHCHECMQSLHLACAPSILRYETHPYKCSRGVHKFVNVKFGGTYTNFEVHQHPLLFVQGLAGDVCAKCRRNIQYEMVFKCLSCKFVVDVDCCEYLSW